jgi:hypothetical protein
MALEHFRNRWRVPSLGIQAQHVGAITGALGKALS